MTIEERPNKKNNESHDLTGKVNFLRLWRGKYVMTKAVEEVVSNSRSVFINLMNNTNHIKLLYLRKVRV